MNLFLLNDGVLIRMPATSRGADKVSEEVDDLDSWCTYHGQVRYISQGRLSVDLGWIRSRIGGVS